MLGNGEDKTFFHSYNKNVLQLQENLSMELTTKLNSYTTTLAYQSKIDYEKLYRE